MAAWIYQVQESGVVGLGWCHGPPDQLHPQFLTPPDGGIGQSIAVQAKLTAEGVGACTRP
jgi:hypothetical protein